MTTVFEADFGAVLAHRERHREAFASRGAPLTLTAYVIAACVDAIRAVPETNARWTEDALEIIERIDIGVATALPGGALIVPVIRDVAALDLEEIARRLADLTTRAREDRLSPAEVRGGTFTISNHGVSGSLLAAPIVINQPQSAILGVGKLERRPVVVDSDGEERIAIRPRCYLTLTIDHRVMDGQRANAFMEVLGASFVGLAGRRVISVRGRVRSPHLSPSRSMGSCVRLMTQPKTARATNTKRSVCRSSARLPARPPYPNAPAIRASNRNRLGYRNTAVPPCSVRGGSHRRFLRSEGIMGAGKYPHQPLRADVGCSRQGS